MAKRIGGKVAGVPRRQDGLRMQRHQRVDAAGAAKHHVLGAEVSAYAPQEAEGIRLIPAFPAAAG